MWLNQQICKATSTAAVKAYGAVSDFN